MTSLFLNNKQNITVFQLCVRRLDTIVRDWYFDGRYAGLNHSAAYEYATIWDDISGRMIQKEDNDSNFVFNYEAEQVKLLNDYLSGKIIADNREIE